MTGRVVVVGAGLAGLRTAESLRTQGFAGEVVVVGDEVHLPYNRPPLSKEALAGNGISHESLAFRHKPSVADVHWRLGQPVIAADLESATVTLADGEQVGGDALVLATGVRPRRLSLQGPSLGPASGHHVVRTVDDAAALRDDLRPGHRLVVLGAGFIGCEVAATARHLNLDVTCAAYDALPMVRPLGPELAAALQRRHEAEGVRFHLGVGVTGLTGDQRVTGVTLSDGTHIPADVVVEAVGSVCATEWLADNDLDTSDGVRADNALRPVRADGQPHVNAAVVGDLVRYPNPLFDDVARRVEHWNIPTETGRRAGAVLAAKLAGDPSAYDTVVASPFEPMPAFWSDQYSLRIQSFGLPSVGTSIRVLEGSLDDEVVVGYFRDDVLVGVVGVGLLKSVMALRGVIGKPLPD